MDHFMSCPYAVCKNVYDLRSLFYRMTQVPTQVELSINTKSVYPPEKSL